VSTHLSATLFQIYLATNLFGHISIWNPFRCYCTWNYLDVNSW